MNAQLKASSYFISEPLAGGDIDFFGYLCGKGPYWHNTNESSINKDESKLSKQARGLWRAIKQTSIDTPSLKGCNLSLDTSRNSDNNFLIKVESNMGDKVFDMILLTYFKYIAGIWWIAKGSGNVKSPPTYIYLRARASMSNSFETAAFQNSPGSGNFSVAYNAISDNLKKTLQKAIKGANNVDAAQFKSRCVMLQNGEMSKVVADVTDCDSLFQTVGGGNGVTTTCKTNAKNPNVTLQTKIFPIRKQKGINVISTGRWHCRRKSGEIHPGIDFGTATSPNVPIYAMADGEVTFSGPNHGFGYSIIIMHKSLGDGQNCLYSLYGHIAPSVYAGTTVRQGQQIGTTNKFPDWDEHLHFTVMYNSINNPGFFFCNQIYPGDYITNPMNLIYR